MKTYCLDGNWDLFYYNKHNKQIGSFKELEQCNAEKITARVPGNVELDLSDAGILPSDLYYGDNIEKIRSYESYEWWYRKKFNPGELDCRKGVSIVFHGVDTVATYWLNGEKIGESRNMLIDHSFDVTGILRPNVENEIVVRIEPTVLYYQDMEYYSYMTTFPMNWCGLHARKAPHMFGWDIMPRAISAGIWRGVKIVCKDSHEIEDFYVATLKANEKSASMVLQYKIRTELSLLEDIFIRFSGECGNSHFEKTDKIFFPAGFMRFDVQNPALWSPRGYGRPNLYNARIELIYNGKVLAAKEWRVGIRKIELVREDGIREDDPSFLFKVNGVPILCKGTNWVPADAFHSRDRERIANMLPMLTDLNCNIVRCWGGNVYEDKEFFDFCDENGIMVWQDFAMACGSYPLDDEFFSDIKNEIKSVVKKLRNHVCLAVWCGDNECDYNYYIMGLDPAKNRLTREIIPQEVLKHDAYRVFVPSSPYFSHEVVEKGDLLIMPEQHLWGARDYFKSSYYKHSKADFIGEIGYHGCPPVSSVKKFISPESLWPWMDNKEWLIHAVAPEGEYSFFKYRIKLMSDQIVEMFGRNAENLEEYAIASQISQAEALKFFIENVRINKWKKTGVIWWNLIDGWPQFSDSVVDYYYEKKLAYYYIKRLQQPVCIMIGEPVAWKLAVVLSNDSNKDAELTYTITDADTEVVIMEGNAVSKANENMALGFIPVSVGIKQLFLINWEIDGVIYKNHYLHGMPPFSLETYRSWLDKIEIDINLQ